MIQQLIVGEFKSNVFFNTDSNIFFIANAKQSHRKQKNFKLSALFVNLLECVILESVHSPSPASSVRIPSSCSLL